METFLSVDDFSQLLAVVATAGELHAAVRSEDGVERLQRGDPQPSGLFSPFLPLIPAKKYLLPPRDSQLSYSRGKYRGNSPPDSPLVLFGLHPCDLAAIAYLDRIFLAPPADPWYRRRRRRLTLVGASCSPGPECRCTTFPVEPCYDIFLRQAEGGYAIRSGSSRGRKIVSQLGLKRIPGLPPAAHPVGKFLPGEPSSEFLEELSTKCFSCGACSVCCPTCFCFTVREQGCAAASPIERLREWDNCLFEQHGAVAGYDFRPQRRQRFLYRYTHKVQGFGAHRGMPACVGCGRCNSVCPAGLDLEKLTGGGR